MLCAPPSGRSTSHFGYLSRQVREIRPMPSVSLGPEGGVAEDPEVPHDPMLPTDSCPPTAHCARTKTLGIFTRLRTNHTCLRHGSSLHELYSLSVYV
eukprot:scaffold1219_cov400-Prasinococcus_capsulatus_cf.AAC.28